MKKVLKNLFIIIIFIFVLNVMPVMVKANIIDDNLSGTGSGFAGSGGWYPACVGIKVSIVSNTGRLKQTNVLVNNAKCLSDTTLLSTNMHKTSRYNNNTWEKYNSQKVYVLPSGYLPANWQPNNEFINFRNFLKNSNYEKFKAILGYKINDENKIFINISNSDYILVEPMAYIDGYFGTVYELSSLENKTSSCVGESHTFSWCYKGVLTKIADSLYNLNQYNSLNLNKKTSCASNYKYGIKDQNCGYGVGVYENSEIIDEPPESATLVIRKIDSSGNLISNSATFSLTKNGYYNSDNQYVEGKNFGSKDTSGGIINWAIEPGSYQLIETRAPDGYEAQSINVEYIDQHVYFMDFSISVGETKVIDVVNYSKSCEAELSNLIQTYNINDNAEEQKAARIRLFINNKSYREYRKILDFKEQDPQKICQKTDTGQIDSSVSCLNSEIIPKNYDDFNFDNLSSYYYLVGVGEGNNFTSNVAFCQEKIEVKSKVYNTDFISKAGMMYFNNPADGLMAQAELYFNCYAFDRNGYFIPDDYSTIKGGYFLNSIIKNMHFGDVNDSESILETEYSIDDPIISDKVGDQDLTFFAIRYYSGKEIKYKINYYNRNAEIYLEKGTGKVFSENCPTCTFLGYGRISKLTENGIYNLPFGFEYKMLDSYVYKKLNSDCNYAVVPELVKDDKLNLEFRIIDVGNPFPGKSGNDRVKGSNWNIPIGSKFDINGDGKISGTDTIKLRRYLEGNSTLTEEQFERADVNFDGVVDSRDLEILRVVLLIIDKSGTNDYTIDYAKLLLETAPNSYGNIYYTKAQVEPKYVIELTADDITKVRNYKKNNNISYDKFNYDCSSGTCINLTLQDLSSIINITKK